MSVVESGLLALQEQVRKSGMPRFHPNGTTLFGTTFLFPASGLLSEPSKDDSVPDTAAYPAAILPLPVGVRLDPVPSLQEVAHLRRQDLLRHH